MGRPPGDDLLGNPSRETTLGDLARLTHSRGASARPRPGNVLQCMRSRGPLHVTPLHSTPPMGQFRDPPFKGPATGDPSKETLHDTLPVTRTGPTAGDTLQQNHTRGFPTGDPIHGTSQCDPLLGTPSR
jgi:hypothetical protein